MYKLIIFIAFLLLISSLAFSQEYQYVPFPDSGAVWSEIFYCHDEYAEDKTTYERFAVNGEDTIMNNIAYSKLYLFYDTIFDRATATCIGGIREDSLRRVYYSGQVIHHLKPNPRCVNDNQEIKLFDFGVELGDTVWSFNNFNNLDGLIISDIDTILLDNTFHRKINFKGYNKDDAFWGFTWIEGIGSTRGLLFISGDVPYTYQNHLICFKQNGNTIFLNELYSECFPNATSINEQTYHNQISVFPNPVVDNEIKFEFNGLNVESISLFNEQGCFIATYHVTKLEKAFFSVHDFAPGLYFYTAADKHGILMSGKFVMK